MKSYFLYAKRKISDVIEFFALAAISAGDLISRYKPIAISIGVSYSSTNNDLVNTNQGQDFFDTDVRDILLSWYSGQGEDYPEETLVEYFGDKEMSEDDINLRKKLEVMHKSEIDWEDESLSDDSEDEKEEKEDN